MKLSQIIHYTESDTIVWKPEANGRFSLSDCDMVVQCTSDYVTLWLDGKEFNLPQDEPWELCRQIHAQMKRLKDTFEQRLEKVYFKEKQNADTI